MSGTIDSKEIQTDTVAISARANALSPQDDAEPGPTEITQAIPTFEGFKDFELDLSCLSPPATPPESVLDLDLRIPSPTATPSPRQSLSIRSIASSPSSILSPRSFSSMRTAHASLPLRRYIGRGTPVDRNRQIEWGRAGGTDEIGEDGFLIFDASPDCVRPRPSHRSMSPDWNTLTQAILAPRPATLPARNKSRSSARTQQRPPSVPAPEIQIDGLGEEKAEEWSSFMQTVLEPTNSEAEEATMATSSHKEDLMNSKSDTTTNLPSMSPEEIKQLDPGIDMDLGNEALDLGLTVGRDLSRGADHTGYTAGYDSPSLYSSQLPSPLPSRPPSVAPSEPRSTTSIKGEPGNRETESKSAGPWWQRFRRKLGQMQVCSGTGYH